MPELQIQSAREEHKYYPYSGIFYLFRNSFWLAGQDSWTRPPAQNPDNFVQLTNIEPVTNGILQRRRGYNLLSQQTPTNPFLLGYSFRSELLNLRSVVFTSPQNVMAITEAGANYLNPVFTPSPGASRPRMVLSRSYGYFADGIIGDNKKWDGTQPANSLTNWGIALNTGATGPNTATAGSDQGGAGNGGSVGPSTPQAGSGTSDWTGSTATTGIATKSGSFSGSLNGGYSVSNFGFNVPSTATILGVVVSVTRSFSVFCSRGSSGTCSDSSVLLTKGNVSVGSNHASFIDWPVNINQTVSYGSSSDLWGTTWTPADINSSGFGLFFNTFVTVSNICNIAVDVSAVQITVYYGFVGPPWSNTNNIATCGSSVATSTASTSITSDLRGTGFGFSVGGFITGIQVTLQASTSGPPVNVNPILVKAGSAVGLRKSLTVTSNTLSTLTFGGQFDLWGGSWTPTDVNNANFGFQVDCNTLSGTATVSLNCFQITVFTQAGPLTVGAPTGSGNITLLSGRTYFYVFQNSKTTATSTLSPASASTGKVSGVASIPISGIPTPNDLQADTVIILATADGNDQTHLFFVGVVPAGTATFNDTTPDTAASGATLLTNSVYQETDQFGLLHGVANNFPPLAIQFPIKHKGRIFGAIGQTLYFSKNLDEVTTSTGTITTKYEEAWPFANQFDISELAETIQGLLSDGETLWIGTERSIRRLIGDSPSNFQKPEIEFNETGLLNQDVWKVTFYEGQPVGTIWLTPDFRVMGSDFNTYKDIGTPIQDILNTINRQATIPPHASFVSKGQSDYYMLYLPTGANKTPDTVCVFNLRTEKWFVWKPTDSPTASLFFIDTTGAPRWLFAANSGPIYEWTEGIILDRANTSMPIGYPASVQTSWLDLGDRNLRKALNQIIYLGNDPIATVGVEGALLDADLNVASVQIIPATPVTLGPLGELFVPLASAPSFHRWYRFTFTSPGASVVDVVTGFSAECTPLFRY